MRRAARVDADLHLGRRTARLQVEQPHVIARGGAGAAGDDQPAAIQGDRAAVVVGGVETLAPDELVGAGVGADDVPPHASVVLLLAVRDVGGREPADVEERRPAGLPGDGRVAAPVDGPVEPLPGGDVEHVQQRLLVAAAGQLVGQPGALFGGRPGVEGGGPRRVEPDRVQQRPLGAVRVAGQQDGVLLPGRAAQPERPALAPGRRADRSGRQQRLDPRGEPVPTREGVEVGAGQRILRRGPRDGLRRVRVLQPPVGVGHRAAVQSVDDVEPGSGGVGHRPDPRRLPARRALRPRPRRRSTQPCAPSSSGSAGARPARRTSCRGGCAAAPRPGRSRRR